MNRFGAMNLQFVGEPSSDALLAGMPWLNMLGSPPLPIIRPRRHIETRPRSDFDVYHGCGMRRGRRYLVLCQGKLGFVTVQPDGWLQPVMLTDRRLMAWGIEQVERGEVSSVERDRP